MALHFHLLGHVQSHSLAGGSALCGASQYSLRFKVTPPFFYTLYSSAQTIFFHIPTFVANRDTGCIFRTPLPCSTNRTQVATCSTMGLIQPFWFLWSPLVLLLLLSGWLSVCTWDVKLLVGPEGNSLLLRSMPPLGSKLTFANSPVSMCPTVIDCSSLRQGFSKSYEEHGFDR